MPLDYATCRKWVGYVPGFFFFTNCLAGTVCQKSPGGLAGLGTRAEIISISDGLILGQPRGHADDPREFEDSGSEYRTISEMPP